MKSVWIVKNCADYEGFEIKRCYDSFEKALAKEKELKDSRHYWDRVEVEELKAE